MALDRAWQKEHDEIKRREGIIEELNNMGSRLQERWYELAIVNKEIKCELKELVKIKNAISTL